VLLNTEYGGVLFFSKFIDVQFLVKIRLYDMDAVSSMFNEIMKSYQVDGDGLAVIAESGMLSNMLNNFKNYELFLGDRNKQFNSKKFIKKISKGSNVVFGVTNDVELRKIFYYAHLAACCELFNGWVFPLNTINRDSMRALIDHALYQFKNAPIGKLNEFQSKIHKSDVVRTIQVLRMMGLLTSNSESQRQLSFAAGNAERELDGVHMLPVIRHQKNAVDNSNIIEFSKHVNRPEKVVLIDNAPAFKELYDSLNQDHSDWVLALNEDADSAIRKTSELISDNKIKPCNMIAGIRIDHEIIPDVACFFKQLVPVIDSVADLIISVGAGHTLEEFEGRINLMSAMFDYLKKQGMEPVKIILHGSGSAEAQRASPLFGNGPTTTYEILYCKIKKKKLL